jgi:predicted nuclease of restriction endonuclease-like (RecB) superfamily
MHELTNFYSEIKDILANARKKAYSAVNFAMVEAYWLIGKRIFEEEQNGKERADYGEYLIKNLSIELKNVLGKGFFLANLKNFRQFYIVFPDFQKSYALSSQWVMDFLLWAGSFASVQKQAIFISIWFFYNYILKCFVLIDLKVGKLTHQDIGQMDMYVRMFDNLKKQNDDNPTIGIILCSQKDDTTVKYSVLKENEQLFASKYRLVLPSEEELAAEVERERRLIENRQRVGDE